MTYLKPAEKIGRKFQNPVPTDVGGLSVALKVLPEFITNREQREPKEPLGPFRTDSAVYARPPATGLRVTWFGHSAMLVEIDGVRLLLDPVWDERASPFSFMGPKRFFAPTIALGELPELDAVVFSHDHFDHLGAKTVRTLAAARTGMRWIVPLGVGAVLRGLGVPAARITELDWTGSTNVGLPGREITLTAAPARHFSGRSLSNRFETLWASYVLKGPTRSVYYGADSGEWPGFSEIGAAYGPFDLTALEIGAFHPAWASIHMGPEGAMRSFATLGGQGLFMPVHWALFDLALHGWRQPIEQTWALADGAGVKLWSPEPGLPTQVEAGKELRSDWWRRG